jgi:hypothetical protein
MKKLKDKDRINLLERRSLGVSALSGADVNGDHAFEVRIKQKSKAVGSCILFFQFYRLFSDV